MAIWEKGTESILCRHCGARHQADYRDYLLSEFGSQDCLGCGKELISWSGTRAYIVFRLESDEGASEATKKLPCWKIVLASTMRES